jgi:hypothetical protein
MNYSEPKPSQKNNNLIETWFRKKTKTKTNIHIYIYMWLFFSFLFRSFVRFFSLFFPVVFYMFDHPGHQVTCERNNAEKNKTKKKTRTCILDLFVILFLFVFVCFCFCCFFQNCRLFFCFNFCFSSNSGLFFSALVFAVYMFLNP